MVVKWIGQAPWNDWSYKITCLLWTLNAAKIAHPQFVLLTFLFNGDSTTVLFLAAILDLVLVLFFWTKMLFSFSQIFVTSMCTSFSPVLVDENSNRF